MKQYSEALKKAEEIRPFVSDEEFLLANDENPSILKNVTDKAYKAGNAFMNSFLTYNTDLRRYKDDFEDLINVSIAYSLKKYHVGRNNFLGYVCTVMRHSFWEFASKERKEQARVSLHMDDPIKESNSTIGDILGSADHRIFSGIELLERKQVIAEAASTFSEEERYIWAERMKNVPFQKIAEALNCDVKHVRYLYAKAIKRCNNSK